METEQFKARMSAFREALAGLTADAVEIKNTVAAESEVPGQNKGEILANVTLAYRHLEDAAMRFGKAIQAADGGTSPLGGPATPAAIAEAPAEPAQG